MAIHEIIILVLATTLVWAAVNDALWYRIPNVVPLAIVALYPIYLVIDHRAVESAHWALLTAITVFLIGFVMFSRGAMGGGDVKLLTAVALWAGPTYFPTLVLTTAIAGGVLALAVIVASHNPYLEVATFHLRAAMGLPSAPKSAKGGRTIPYGIAIAIGGLLVCAQLYSAGTT